MCLFQFSFWVAASLDPAFWQTGASLIPLGLSVGNAIGARRLPSSTPCAPGRPLVTLNTRCPHAGIVILGNCVIAVPIVLNGMVGANLRIPFPVAARASMGYWLSYFAVISRCFLSLIWFGVETVRPFPPRVTERGRPERELAGWPPRRSLSTTVSSDLVLTCGPPHLCSTTVALP